MGNDSSLLPPPDELAAGEKTILHISEETDDDLLTSTPQTHTTEDLFTIIHRFAHAAHMSLALFLFLSLALSASL